MNTYFVRHNTGIWIDDNTRRRLWKERRIAIHYARDPYTKKKMSRDCSSINPDDYAGKGKSCMKILVELAREGGYVCAEHRLYTDWMVGFVRPNSKIKLLEGKYRDGCEFGGQTAVLKTLRLTKVEQVKPLDYAVLSVCRPRATISQWHKVSKRIENLVEGRTSERQLSDLIPGQQEIFCSEFLRLPQAVSFDLPRLAHLLVPTGRTMRDIDIIGIAADGKRLLAQVTFDQVENAQKKIDQLLPYGDPTGTHLILFCECADRTEQKGVTIFPIQQAYDVFTSTPLGRIWLRHC
jgi:hypothetical protein